MSGPQFFQTAMGRTFYEGTMPELVKQLKRLNANLEPHPDSRIPYVLTQQGRQEDTTVPISDGTRKGVPRCPTCGSTRLHVTIHTMYEMVDGKLQREAVTEGPDENLAPDDYTICTNCDHEGDFSEFDKEE